MDTLRMAFVLAAMNNLKVCAANISTAFLYRKTREKVYIIAGKEFGEYAGKRMVIDKGLYGLKTSSAIFHESLSSKLRKWVLFQARLTLTSGFVQWEIIMIMWLPMWMISSLSLGIP